MTISKRDVWQKLMNYQSSELVKKSYLEKYNLELNSGKAQEISIIFTQARYYFDAASLADRSIKPLLLYYGVLSLSRGLTLFLTRGLREAALAPSHGLSAIDWGNQLHNENSDISNLKICINEKGTFRELIEATENISLLRQNSSVHNYKRKDNIPAAESELTVIELLERIPEVREILVHWKPNKTMFVFHDWNTKATNNQTIKVFSPYTSSDVASVMGNKYKHNGGDAYSAASDIEFPTLSDIESDWGIGDLVAMKLYDYGGGLSKLMSTFVISYALGMLVRYHPSHWISILHNNTGNAAMPTLTAVSNHIENSMPRMVFELLQP